MFGKRGESSEGKVAAELDDICRISVKHHANLYLSYVQPLARVRLKPNALKAKSKRWGFIRDRQYDVRCVQWEKTAFREARGETLSHKAASRLRISVHVRT
jgi:hypothetical protein